METCWASNPDPGVQIPPSPPRSFFLGLCIRVSFDPDAHTVNEDRIEDSSISVQDSSEINTGNIAFIPEFSSILLPIASVLMIVGFNYRRRISLDA